MEKVKKILEFFKKHLCLLGIIIGILVTLIWQIILKLIF